ncbi:MAG: ABC transporter ATP-binding protein/permease [Defluviitaleaceae bacterium]|nr:ABC transporter ATP-binding protein/permease [Defluviitaleaceae bacterium]
MSTKNQTETAPIYTVKFDDNTAAFERDILKENPLKMSYLIRLFKDVFSSAKVICGVFLGLAIIVSILQPVSALVWARYLDATHAYIGIQTVQTSQILTLVGLLVLFWVIGFVSHLIQRFTEGYEDIERLNAVQSNRLQEKYQTKMLAKIQRLYPDYMEVPRINDIINRSFEAMGGSWSGLQQSVMVRGYLIIAKIVSVVAVAASLFIFNPWLTLLVLLAPLPTLYTTYVGNKLNFKFSRDNQKVLRESDYYQGVMVGQSASEVKALNLFDFFFAKWKVLADDYTVREKKNQLVVFLLGSVSGFITNIASIVAQIFAIILLTQGLISVGALGAVFILIQTLIGSTSSLFASFSEFISKKNEASQFFELLDLDEQVATAAAAGKMDISQIDVKNLTYRYPLTDEIRINGVNFSIKKGEKVAFVGENGAGKTTFIKLLTGMLAPSAGEILLDGKPVSTINFADRYDSMSYVFQETAKFETFTIADNVFLGDVARPRDEQQIDEALNFAAFDFSDERTKDTVLGKDIGGTDLSGGQWQKVSIARAYYRGRDFVILDEPTSNLDPLAETEVFKQYMAMSAGKTVITVTHRISVASLADRVVVFKGGEIVEDGSHEALLQNNGEYKRLYETQAEFYDR